MRSKHSLTRRRFGSLMAAGTVAMAAPAVIGGALPKIAVVGGGPAGCIAARRLAGTADVTLLEPNTHYVTPFRANRLVAGLTGIDDVRFTYDRLGAVSNLTIAADRATGFDMAKRTIRTESGEVITYDRLIVSPGVAARPGTMGTLTPKDQERFPHAYITSHGDQWQRLSGQLKAMPDGGVCLISIPKRPYRCHPAPYERATLIAGYLARTKPKSKVLVLDSNETFPLMDVLVDHWEEAFADRLEWVPADFGGAVSEIDAKAGTVQAGDETFRPDVGNIIPPQMAGSIAVDAGLTDLSGWCPVEPDSFLSRKVPGIHVLGDAADAGDMPRSASSAASQAVACTEWIKAELTGRSSAPVNLTNACYFLTEPGQSLIISGRYKIVEGRIAGVEQLNSEPGDDEELKRKRAADSDAWFSNLTKEMFG